MINLDFSTSNFHSYLIKLGYGDEIESVCRKGDLVEILPSESCTGDQLKEMNAIKDSYNWDKPDFWMPQLSEFKERVFNLLPGEVKLNLAPTLFSIQDKKIVDYWKLVLEVNPKWLTEDLKTYILNVAKECNVAL